MDIFVKRLPANKGHEFYFAFSHEDLKDIKYARARDKGHCFDHIENIINSAPEFYDEEEHFIDYCCSAGSSWLLNELITSDFQGSIQSYKEVYMVCLYEKHNEKITQHATEIISSIAYKLSESNIMINKFMINAL